jgi:glycogen debranching enzyme
MRPAHASAFAWTATVYWRPVSTASSSRGWTPGWVTGRSRRESESPSRFKRSGTTRSRSRPLSTGAGGLLPSIRRAFAARFWNEARTSLADVVDVNHAPGSRDDTFRPNQILAIGGLPLPLIGGRRARRIVDAVESELVTPIGLRSLARFEPSYVDRYAGGPAARDAAYHQGTVWPWLLGPFVEAWVRTHGNDDDTRRAARKRFLQPLTDHLRVAGLSHLSEIADATSPFTPRGCPFQAWSLGEYLRLDRQILRVGGTVETRAALEDACV